MTQTIRGDTVNVNLTPELEKLVRDKVKSGQYESAVDVVRDALRFLEEGSSSTGSDSRVAKEDR
jgi:antitoxin ParD1/3/4